jgi:hypothetical protein
MVLSMRGSLGAMKKVSGINKADASRASDPYDWTNAWRLGLQPLAITSS